MSTNKITELLQNGTMIDFNLISDSLSTILKEMCQIISDQSQELDSIKKQIPNFAIKNEVEQKIKLQADTTTNIQNGLNNLCQITQQKLEEVAQTIQVNIDNTNKQISDLKEQVDSDTSEKIKDIQSNFFFSNSTNQRDSHKYQSTKSSNRRK